MIKTITLLTALLLSFNAVAQDLSTVTITRPDRYKCSEAFMIVVVDGKLTNAAVTRTTPGIIELEIGVPVTIGTLNTHGHSKNTLTFTPSEATHQIDTEMSIWKCEPTFTLRS